MVRLTSMLVPHLVAERHTVDRAVYGTVSVLAVIAGTSHGKEASVRVFLFAAASSVVFWAVHVYASVLADMGPDHLAWGPAVRKALTHEQGVFGGVAVPLTVLALGAIGLLEDDRAILLSMWSGVVVLVVTPLVWLRPRGRAWGPALAVAAFGGLLGVVLIWSKVFLH